MSILKNKPILKMKNSIVSLSFFSPLATIEAATLPCGCIGTGWNAIDWCSIAF